MHHFLEFLESKLREGYCLHGSPKLIIGDIVPRQASCNSGRLEGNQYAVYADPNSAMVPCVMALLTRKDPFKGSLLGYNGDGTFLSVTGENATFAPGFVYILPRKTFTYFDYEFISYHPVRPHFIVRVTPSILWPLLARGKLDLRIEVPAPW